MGVFPLGAYGRNIRNEGVIYVPLKQPAPTIELHVVWRQNDPSPVAANFLNIAREVVQEK